MLTDLGGGAQVALFLFAHQDDEFGVFHQIALEHSLGRRVVCVYFTTGVPRGGDPSRRNDESLAVLGAIGVLRADVIFAGELLGIDDGCLAEHFGSAAQWLESWMRAAPLASVYLLAWEGGHPDHDGLHALAAQLLYEQDAAHLGRQFSLYNGWRCPGPFFRVLSPLSQNGAVQSSAISWPARWRHLSYCLRYHSQWKTWVGLFPFVLLHYLLQGRQNLQALPPACSAKRPHEGDLYYEKRRFATWPALQSRIEQWRAARLPR